MSLIAALLAFFTFTAGAFSNQDHARARLTTQAPVVDPCAHTGCVQ